MSLHSQPRLVLATRNRHKVVELGRILALLVPELEAGEVVGAGDLARLGMPDPGDVAETGVTFAENALLKARAVAAVTGLPAVADDSGLCVEVLGGSPGVFSARWAGRHGDDAANLQLLLAQLADVTAPHRGAWFECAAALVVPGPGAAGVGTAGADDAGLRAAGHLERLASGRLPGTLAAAPRGSGGFGYDPVLVPVGSQRTCAELAPQEKDAISHRGQALRALAPEVATVLQGPAGARPGAPGR